VLKKRLLTSSRRKKVGGRSSRFEILRGRGAKLQLQTASLGKAAKLPETFVESSGKIRVPVDKYLTHLYLLTKPTTRLELKPGSGLRHLLLKEKNRDLQEGKQIPVRFRRV